jgi:hypothetical protein
MSINSISSICGYSSASYLSEETKRKLLALGIDPSTVTSETQAKKLIEKAQSNSSVKETTKAENKTVCSSESEILTKAKILAQKIGIKLSKNMSIDEILQSISDKITEMLNSEDKGTQETAKGYQQELSQISEEYTPVKQNQNSMYAMLTQSANINKYMLGLN